MVEVGNKLQQEEIKYDIDVEYGNNNLEVDNKYHKVVEKFDNKIRDDSQWGIQGYMDGARQVKQPVPKLLTSEKLNSNKFNVKTSRLFQSQSTEESKRMTGRSQLKP